MGMILPTKAMAVQELTIKRKLSENALQVWPLVDDTQGGGKEVLSVCMHASSVLSYSVRPHGL